VAKAKPGKSKAATPKRPQPARATRTAKKAVASERALKAKAEEEGEVAVAAVRSRLAALSKLPSNRLTPCKRSLARARERARIGGAKSKRSWKVSRGG
jgi:hypothetical protein